MRGLLHIVHELAVRGLVLALQHTVYKCRSKQAITVTQLKDQLIVVTRRKRGNTRGRLVRKRWCMKSAKGPTRLDGFIIADDLERSWYIFILVASPLYTGPMSIAHQAFEKARLATQSRHTLSFLS